MAKRTETRAGDVAPVVIADGGSTRTVRMRWGFASDAGRLRFLVRDDSPEIDQYARCLIPATALPLTDRKGGKWTVALQQPGTIFCFAGVWRQAADDWAGSYAAVTVAAYPDVKPVKRRHIAILPQASWAEWLAGTGAESVLRPLPRGSLSVVPA